MKLSEKLKDINDSGDVGLYVESLIGEALSIEVVLDALTAENKRLDLCLSRKTDIANNLKDELSESFLREIDAKHKHDEILDKYLKLKFHVEKMLINGDWYIGAIEGNPKIDFSEIELEIKRLIEWDGDEQ